MNSMLPSIVFNDPDHGVAIANACGLRRYLGADSSIVRLTPEGKLAGGVVYTDYTGVGGSVEVHVAGLVPRWVSRDLLWVAFHYPFEQLLVKKIIAPVQASNSQAFIGALHLGFTTEHVVKDKYPGSDMLQSDMFLMGMYRSACRFLSIVPRGLEDRSHGR